MSIQHPRRRLLTLSAGIAVWGLPALWRCARAQAPAPRRLTPSQTEGPFYPVDLPEDTDFDLLQHGDLHYTGGAAALVEGTVTDLDGRPVRGAAVEIWQCDHNGHYHHPGDGGRADPAFQGFGRVAVDEQGRWRFQTLRPVAYSGRTPHIHVKVKLSGRELLTTQLYVEGDPGNPRDGLWRRLREADRAAVTVPFQPQGDRLHALFPIVVQA